MSDKTSTPVVQQPSTGEAVGTPSTVVNALAQIFPEIGPPPVPQGTAPMSGQAPQPDPNKIAFDRELPAVTDRVEIARALVDASEAAKSARAMMEQKFAEMGPAANRGDYATALAALRAAHLQADLISEEQVKARTPVVDLYVRTKEAFEPKARTLAPVSAPPPPVAAALETANEANAAARKAVEARPEDWAAARSLVEAFETAAKALDKACEEEAGKAATGFTSRYAPKADVEPAGAEFMKRKTAYLAARKAIDTAIAGKDWAGAIAGCAAVETALASFLAVADPSPQDRIDKAAAGKLAISRLTNEELAGLSIEAKANLALDICANGLPDGLNGDGTYVAGGAMEQLFRVYRQTRPDPTFETKRATQRELIVNEVAEMPEIKALYRANGDFDTDGWDDMIVDPARTLALMQKICNVQCTAMGIPLITVTPYSEPSDANGTSMGAYSPSTNSLSMNMHTDATEDVVEALTTVIHETFHAHQAALIRKLKSGELGPSDPDYATVLMYLVNTAGTGYSSQVPFADYVQQPKELDAENNGSKTATAVLLKAKTAKMGG